MDRKLLTKALGKIPYGLVIIGSRHGNGIAAMVATWVTQVSFYPPLIVAAIESDSSMRMTIDESGVFSVNLLPSGGIPIAKKFLKSQSTDTASVAGHAVRRGEHGSPLLTEAVAAFECRVVNRVPTGDHILFIGEVVDVSEAGNGEVLTLRETGWKYQK